MNKLTPIILALCVIGLFFLQGSLDSVEQELETLRKEKQALQQEVKDLQLENEALREQNERLSTLSSKEDVVRVVMAEARGESLLGQMAVAQTILDRSLEWGKSSGEIINSKSQFAPPYKGKINDLSVFAVDLVYLYGCRVFDAPTTHFYAPDKVEPKWAETKIERGVIGAHRFMY